MATGTRIRQDFIEGTLTNALGAGATPDTTMNSAGLADLLAIDHAANGEYAAVVVGDEILHVTAHTAGATTATVQRGQEGTAIAAHDAGAAWHHGPTEDDFTELASGGGGGGEPWLVAIEPFVTATRNTNWNTTVAVSGIVNGGIKQSSGVQNDAIEWDLELSAGTWAVDFIHRKGANQGIIHVYLDGTQVGTVDCYAASTASDFVVSFTGVSVAASGKHTLKLAMETKNASSSAYYGQIQALQMRRTA